MKIANIILQQITITYSLNC